MAMLTAASVWVYCTVLSGPNALIFVAPAMLPEAFCKHFCSASQDLCAVGVHPIAQLGN